MVTLPLASQHLDVKTIGRGGPLRRLFKPDKWTPLFARLSTVAGRSGPGRNVAGTVRLTPHKRDQVRCLSWVIRVGLTLRCSLPVFPNKQTFSRSVGMSQRCQKRTHARELDRLRRR